MTNKRILTGLLLALSLAACGVAAIQSSPATPESGAARATGGIMVPNGLAPAAFIAGNPFAQAPTGT